MRNTPEAIKQMAGTLSSGNRSGTFGISANAIDALLFNGSTGRESEARVAGLLPIQLDLPNNGVAYDFAGGGEPGTLTFRYTDWRSAARWRWVWLTLGATAFLLFAAGWARPWRRTLGVVLALTFWPLVDFAPGPDPLQRAPRRMAVGGARLGRDALGCCVGGGSLRWPPYALARCCRPPRPPH